MNSVCKVLLVDDHAMFTEALGEHLARDPRFNVVGIVHNAEAAIEKAMVTNPDVIVMDIDMPGLISFEAARTIETMVGDARIIFLSAFTHDRYIEQALAVKARAYVTKGEKLERVVDAIRTVTNGGTFFSKEVRERLRIESNGVRLAGKSMNTRVRDLSEREIQVLRYIASGMSKKEIAATMHLAVKTVENHCTNLMAKLNIHDRVELARFAIREGLCEA
ncbi:MAG: response regulator transcription factor [Phycisphaeraceae bacterium]|nr:response regulator transcription factor [Phycisphaeraceae bacterium]